MNDQKVDKLTLSVNVLQSELTQCRSDITAYNAQFLSASTLCAILAAAATVLSVVSENLAIWNLFYLLPTAFFLTLYNVIKYTNEQLKLGAYRMILEHLLNNFLQKNMLRWEENVTHGFQYIFFGAVAQIFFYIPISLFMLWGFAKLTRNWLWYVTCVCMVFQVTTVIVMAFSLLRTKRDILRSFGYKLDHNKLIDLDTIADSDSAPKPEEDTIDVC